MKLLITASIVAFSFFNLQQSEARSHRARSGKHSKKKHRFASNRHSHSRSYAKHRHYLPVDPSNFQSEYYTVADPDTLGHIYFSKIFDIPVDTAADVKLYHSIENWIGTPYRLGGNSHWGIDCSKFVGKIYSDVYNFPVGVNCQAIFHQVQPLSKGELQEGDLIFFKIHSRSVSHMGIYLGNNHFVHSSSSRGVMISSLDDPYFSRYFYSGGRLNLQSTASTDDSFRSGSL